MPTIELTDGTTTYDLTDGAAVSVRANSLNLGNPAASLAASLDYLGDAYRLTDHRFQSRSIGMTLDIRGADRAAVYAHIRNIETALEEARRYAIDQVGSRWRLKYNAGNVAAQDVWFNVRNGALQLPPQALEFLMRTGTRAIGARLMLTCDPLGEGAEQSFGPWNRTNAMNNNYVDITPNPSGDYPAKLELRMAENQAHTALWAGARHWPRQTDTPLDLEAEDFSGWDSTPNESGRSGGEVGRQTFAGGSLSNYVGGFAIYDGALTNGETKTNLTITGSDPNRVLIIFTSGSAGEVEGITWEGAAASLLIQTGTHNRLWAIYSPAAGNAMTFETTGNTRAAIAAVLYQNVDPDLSARTATSIQASRTYTNAQADNIVVLATHNSNASITGGTERVAVDSADDAAIHDIVAATDSPRIVVADWAGFESYLTHLVSAPAAIETNEEEATEVVNSPKFGQFHALAWVKGESDSAYSLYLSTEYGGVERGPAGTFQHARIEQADAGDWVVRDIGALSVPHGGLPDGADLGPLTLKLNGVATTPGLSADVDLDWDRVLLLPVEGGSAYVEKPSATDHVVLDTLSDAPGAYLWASASVFKGQPKYRGGAIYVHPRGTRIYLASDRSGDARPADGWTVTAKVVPRYLMI